MSWIEGNLVREFTGCESVSRNNPYGEYQRGKRAALRARIASFEKSDTTRANLIACEEMHVARDVRTGGLVTGRLGEPVRRVFRCDHRLCPCCAPRRSKRVRDRIKRILKLFRHRPIVQELTCECSTWDLSAAADKFLGAFKRLVNCSAWSDDGANRDGRDNGRLFRKLEKSSRWGVRGYVSTFEVTEGAKGWHFHAHMILDSAFIPQEEMLFLWRRALKQSVRLEEVNGKRVVVHEWEEVVQVDGRDLVRDKVDVEPGKKDGGARLARARGDIAREVGKYIAKGLTSFDGLRDDRLKELVEWTRGKRMFRAGGAFYGVDVGDEESPGFVDEGALVEVVEDEAEAVIGRDSVTGRVVKSRDVYFSDAPGVVDEAWRRLADVWEFRETAASCGVPRELLPWIEGSASLLRFH